MKLTAGLGNPGKKYENTRHNAGFMALDQLAAKNGFEFSLNKKFNAWFFKDGDNIYLKPLTFMNNSGIAVKAVMSYYNMLPKKFGLLTAKDADLKDSLTLIHDDLDIELGKYKISENSRPAGHNGAGSVIDHLKTKHFRRIRIGIKNKNRPDIDAKRFVLGRFAPDELKIIEETIKKIEY